MPRLNPQLPLLWRTPTSCQLGSLEPVAILRETTVNEERALAVLREGTSLATLRALTGQWHMTPVELADFLEQIEPALEPETRPQRRRVSVVGCETGRHEITCAFGDEWDIVESGDHSSIEDSTSDRSSGEVPDVDLVVIVANYVVPLSTAGVWLRRDTPHLLVVFDEQAAHVGPLVVPGLTPCAHCIDEQRRISDEFWPAIATQLMFTPKPETSTALRFQVACTTLWVAQQWREGLPLHAKGFRVTGSTSTVDGSVEFSADCQCRSLTGTVSESEDSHAIQTRTPTTL